MRNWTDRINQINRSYRIVRIVQTNSGSYTSSEIPTLPYPPHIRVFIEIYNNLTIYTYIISLYIELSRAIREIARDYCV